MIVTSLQNSLEKNKWFSTAEALNGAVFVESHFSVRLLRWTLQTIGFGLVFKILKEIRPENCVLRPQKEAPNIKEDHHNWPPLRIPSPRGSSSVFKVENQIIGMSRVFGPLDVLWYLPQPETLKNLANIIPNLWPIAKSLLYNPRALNSF